MLLVQNIGQAQQHDTTFSINEHVRHYPSILANKRSYVTLMHRKVTIFDWGRIKSTLPLSGSFVSTLLALWRRRRGRWGSAGRNARASPVFARGLCWTRNCSPRPSLASHLRVLPLTPCLCGEISRAPVRALALPCRWRGGTCRAPTGLGLYLPPFFPQFLEPRFGKQRDLRAFHRRLVYNLSLLFGQPTVTCPFIDVGICGKTGAGWWLARSRGGEGGGGGCPWAILLVSLWA